ncbi:GntR family transcriptional regulator [Microbacterium sp. SSM24]|uniref:GntR family transcriptional regulator n=1 Tax=Microbacterium sp. SSM24 TaxID=2991714 RepID=UPI002225C93E|nr:GntR family transcriptional regulator [Microbacterium sp. SSM24]MCW3493365.1 GntR family transcriptional regulator [Microbacterium sp. SSM24]
MSVDGLIDIQPIGRVESLASRAATTLREAIVSGAIPTGTDISVPRLARLCGVSVTPVREAVIHLQEAGLVTVHDRGVRVTAPTREALIAAFEVREAIEGMTARLAAQRSTGHFADEVRALAQRTVDAAQGDDVAAFRALDSQFHESVIRLSGSPQLARYARNALDLSQTLRNIRPAPRVFQADSAHRHIEVADAIARGDGDEAENYMRVHVREVLTHMLATMDEVDAE